MRKRVLLFPSSVVYRLSSIVCLSFLFCLLSSIHAYANNITASNVSLVDQSTSAGTVDVQFDISWDNSWRTSTNYDAAWVFVKYSTDGGTTWAHATLKTSGTNPTGFSRGTGTTLDIVVPTDLKGAFLQRSANGSGSVSTTDIEFVWDWNANGLSASTTARVKVFAVEMVYIPEASFSVGDPDGATGPTNCFYTYTIGGAYSIASEGAINVGATSGYLYYDEDNTNDGDLGTPIPAGFPKGYNDFYLMKYEISEGQWVDFFNTLTDAQKSTRDITALSGKNSDAVVNRNTVAWTTGSATTTRQDRGCGYLSWADGIAYVDWAALRPMTELEFEKAARGPSSAVAGEYAWGSASITAAVNIASAENGTETIDTASANCCYNNTTFTGLGDGGTGPLRCGIFAKSTTTRTQASSGYYGNMELSGNLLERAVTVGHATGRSFDGTHGNGALDATGDADVSNWPGTTAAGAGFRGGDWADITVADLTIAGRTDGAAVDATRAGNYGFRCARTAP